MVHCLGERGWVVNGGSIKNSSGIHSLEPLDHMQILGRSAEPGLCSEIGGVDHQRIAFPVTNRVAQPLANISRQRASRSCG